MDDDDCECQRWPNGRNMTVVTECPRHGYLLDWEPDYGEDEDA